jgi:hypothetical protein
MAYDKVVDSIQLDAAMSYTANRIRVKTGDTNQIVWDSAKGFGDAVDTITGGSSAPESDPREVYGGTRPAEWLRLPDYDKVEQNTMYLLVELKENYPNTEKFTFRATSAAVDEGIVVNGTFVSKASRTIAGNGVYNDATITLDYDFNGFDWAKSLSDGKKQIVVRITLTTPHRNIKFNNTYNYYYPTIIRDMIYKVSANDFYTSDLYLYGIRYIYLIEGFPAIDRAYSLEGLGVSPTNSNAGTGYGRLNTVPALRRLTGCPKVKAIAASDLLEELVVDISEFTANGISVSLKSLQKVVFSGTENITAFPGNIGFSNTNLSVAAVTEMFNTLPDISTSETARTITLKNTPAAAAGIPEETLNIATNKGWTVVTA